MLIESVESEQELIDMLNTAGIDLRDFCLKTELKKAETFNFSKIKNIEHQIMILPLADIILSNGETRTLGVIVYIGNLIDIHFIKLIKIGNWINFTKLGADKIKFKDTFYYIADPNLIKLLIIFEKSDYPN